MGGLYDPQMLGKSNYIYIDPQIWTENIRHKVESSLFRYNHYLMSDTIKPDEIPKFRKPWILRAMTLIDEKLLMHAEVYRQVFQEIFENFKLSMK